VRVGSENGYLVRRTQAVRREGVVHGGSEVHVRKGAPRFRERLPDSHVEEQHCPAALPFVVHNGHARPLMSL
jgi:hypothetical protein